MNRLREAGPEHIDRVVKLWAEFVDFHADLDARFERREGSKEGFGDHLRSRLDEKGCLLLVAEADGEVVGYLNAELGQYPPCFANRAHGIVEDLAVHPSWQRSGVGAALLERAMAWFSEKGVEAVEARVLTANPLAMAFWRKAGFEPYMQTFRTFVPPGR